MPASAWPACRSGRPHCLGQAIAWHSLGLPDVTVGAGVRYIGGSWDGIDVLRTPDYTLFDAMVRWDNGPWRLQFNATNIAPTPATSPPVCRSATASTAWAARC